MKIKIDEPCNLCKHCGLKYEHKEKGINTDGLCWTCYIIYDKKMYKSAKKYLTEGLHWYGYKTKISKLKIGWSFAQKILTILLYGDILNCGSLNKTPKQGSKNAIAIKRKVRILGYFRMAIQHPKKLLSLGSSPSRVGFENKLFNQENKMSTKIQINSLPALIHLLEAEGDVAVEIRKSVIKEYENKHVIPSILEKIHKIIEHQVHTELYKDAGRFHSRSYKLKDEYKDKIEQVAKEAVTSQVRRAIQEIVDDATSEAAIKERVGYLVQDIAVHELRKQIKAKLTNALNDK